MLLLIYTLLCVGVDSVLQFGFKYNFNIYFKIFLTKMKAYILFNIKLN